MDLLSFISLRAMRYVYRFFGKREAANAQPPRGSPDLVPELQFAPLLQEHQLAHRVQLRQPHEELLAPLPKRPPRPPKPPHPLVRDVPPLLRPPKQVA